MRFRIILRKLGRIIVRLCDCLEIDMFDLDMIENYHNFLRSLIVLYLFYIS